MLETAIEAASEAAKLLRKNFGSTLNVNQATHYDLKLEMDVRSQQLIADIIMADFPDHCILGEEESIGNSSADVRWVVDPLDGTVNYFYGIPHYAVSIAAQVKRETGAPGTGATTTANTASGDAAYKGSDSDWETIVGVVLAPEIDELFVAEKGKPATLQGRPIHVSDRTQISEAIVAIGFFKDVGSMNRSLEDFGKIMHKVRKIRLTGSAALDTSYVACGRFDAYIEYGIKLWDIAAGQLLLESAGGSVHSKPASEPHSYNVRMSNGKIPLQELINPSGGAVALA
jgi:myo-inositol-1(or 4)-monophosphatase